MSMEEKAPYQIICLDILMPRMDGNEALVAIRQAEDASGSQERAKIIMISSMEDTSVILQSFSQQCDGYIKKPISLSILEEQFKKLGVM